MIKWHHFFLLSLCLIEVLWSVSEVSTTYIIDGESKLIETAGFLVLQSCNAKVEAIVFTIIKI